MDAFRNMLTQFPTGLVACVSDSYDIWKACDTLWGETLRELVVSRKGTLVVRPDSGNPPDVVVQVRIWKAGWACRYLDIENMWTKMFKRILDPPRKPHVSNPVESGLAAPCLFIANLQPTTHWSG